MLGGKHRPEPDPVDAESAPTGKEDLLRRLELIRQCEAFAATAREQATFARDAQPADLWSLPLAAQAVREAGLLQAEAYDRWGEEAHSWDALLSRSLHQLAEEFRALVRRAHQLEGKAEEFVRAEAEDRDEDVPAADDQTRAA